MSLEVGLLSRNLITKERTVTHSTDNFSKRLNNARRGGGILFCGAGFSADCLSFKPDTTLGTGAQLLAIINENLVKLERPGNFGKLQNAADALQREIGENGMLALLKERYAVAEVTEDMCEIVKFPWDSIYTTNYDNSMELAASRLPKQINSLNNTDDPSQISTPTPVIHLHGFIDKWDIKNFGSSCVLGAESYLKSSYLEPWLKRFRDDVRLAQFVAFVGFNAADFHINQVVFDLSGLREKAFFINRPTAHADPDTVADQERLGRPFFFGRSGFAQKIMHTLKLELPSEPRLVSFERFDPPQSAPDVPSVETIENFFLFGATSPEQLARDSNNRLSDFHITRDAVDQVLSNIDDGARILLISGDVCDGKSILVNDLSLRLSSTRPVYQLLHIYDSILDEVSRLLEFAPNAVLVMENCFDLREDRLATITKQFEGEDRILILTSRSISSEAATVAHSSLEKLNNFAAVPMPRLTEREADILSALVAQFAGWRHFYSGQDDQKSRYILKTCEASLPNFLLALLKSKHVRDRYREELSKVSLNADERQAVAIALYVARIGENAPMSFLSNTLELDFGGLLADLNKRGGNHGFLLVRRRGSFVEAVPALGAKNALTHLFSDQELVGYVAEFVTKLSEIYRNDFEQHMFNQMLRYSILKGVVSSDAQINRFFDHLSRLSQLRTRPLFWMQWHMAKTEQKSFVDAEKYLEQGYAAAESYEKSRNITYDRKQLDDRKAKFLMIRAKHSHREPAALFRDFKDACDLTRRLLNRPEPQRYPFQTLETISDAFMDRHSDMIPIHKPMVHEWINGLIQRADSKLDSVPDGYQRRTATTALQNVKARLERL